MGTLGHYAGSILPFLQNQLLGTFAAPGSTFSLAALAVTLALAAMCTMRGRSVTFRTLIRALFPRRMWRTRSGRADIAWFALSVGGIGILFGWALIATPVIGGWTHDLLTASLGRTQATSLPPVVVMVLSTILLFLAYEFAYWVDHWAMHRFKWAWAFHQVHHSAESLSLLTLARVHPVETIGFYNLVAVVMGVTSGFLSYVFGPIASPLTIFGTNALTMIGAVVIGHLQHSHLWVTFGPRWGRLLLGPAHHQIHHSVAPEHHDRNFGNVLTLFDRLFGTFTMPSAARQPIEFGIDASNFDPQSLSAMTVRPFVEAICALPLIGRACHDVAHARKGTAPRAGLLRGDQPGGLHARDHQGGLAPRPSIARIP